MQPLSPMIEQIRLNVHRFLEQHDYFKMLPADVLTRFSKDEIDFQGFSVLSDPEFYYACGVFPEECLETLRVEWQTLFREKALAYVREYLEPHEFSGESATVLKRLEDLCLCPQNSVTNDFTLWDMEKLDIPSEVVASFYPKMDEIVFSLVEKDYDRYLPIIKYFNGDMYHTMDSVRLAMRLYAQYAKRDSGTISLMHAPELLNKDELADEYIKNLYRISAAVNIITNLSATHPVIVDIYQDLGQVCRSLCAREFAALKTMDASVSYPEAAERIALVSDYYQAVFGTSVSDEVWKRDILNLALNVRYVLDKITDCSARKDTLFIYDKSIGLKFDEKNYYKQWDLKRHALGKPCFVAGDGLCAENDTPLSADAKARYRKELSAVWNYWGFVDIFETGEADELLEYVDEAVMALPEMEDELGSLDEQISGLRAMYLLGLLTTEQEKRIAFEEDSLDDESAFRTIIKPIEELMAWVETWNFAPDIPQNPDVIRMVTRFMSAVTLYARRFHDDPQDFKITPGTREIYCATGAIPDWRENGLDAEVTTLLGFIGLLNELDVDRKNTELHRNVDNLVRNFYAITLNGLWLLASDMPERQKSQMTVALEALEKFEDKTAFTPRISQVYIAVTDGIRQLIDTSYPVGSDSHSTALAEFDKWVRPVKQYWQMPQYLSSFPGMKRHDDDENGGRTRT